MAIYILSTQHKKTRQFYKSNDLHKHEDIMVFYMLVSAVLDGQDDYAYQLIERLLKLNPQLLTIFQYDEFREHLAYYADGPSYQPNSLESLAIVLDELFYIFIDSDYLYNTIRNNIIDIYPEFEDLKEEKRSIDTLLKIEKADKLAGKGIFTNINSTYVRPLVMEGLENKGDFAEVTKEQVLAIDGIGPATVRKLEENGVRFKS